ncbi:hypothetical protein PHISCL_06890 [Aspergillus sclerotialis]|uniref:BTB domain-containing protein n=1 Tax=Aspergillus sclerotialis TaxID=2070753 RepID=A0A3A2ZUT0_9EURO|nr:hypothetical protein PHISCL_06890 [Aspergillus sclerotialis]
MKTSDKERNHILDRLPGLLLMLCAWSSSVKLFQQTCPLLSASVFVVSLICFEVDLWLASFHGESDCNIMFKRSFSSKDRAGKSARSSKKKYSEREKVKLQESLDETSLGKPVYCALTSPIITLIVGPEQRVFAAHEDVLSSCPYFCAAMRNQFLKDGTKRVDLPDEEPEILSCVLEFLYKGDYYPRLLHNPRRDSWQLENAEITQTGGCGSSEATMYHSQVGDTVLRDSVVYCAAEKYGLEDLKTLALRKQGFQSGIPVDVILRSARYAYDNTPDSESRLRAHYLAMIIRCRKIFKKSGTMQLEMEVGHKFYFDLFVAMCNHMDDLVETR